MGRGVIRSVRVVFVASLLACLSTGATRTAAFAPQQEVPADPKATYDALKAFVLDGVAIEVTNLPLKRDRLEIGLTGTLYPAVPVGGRVTGAVFIGQGQLHAAVPASTFEKDNVRRMLGADALDMDFKTAVLRFTDDTFALIDGRKRESAAPDEAKRLAAAYETRLLTENGVNLSSRLALSIINREVPGMFAAEFDGGRRGRFSAIIDPQRRVPATNFAINGGEKGIVFAPLPALYSQEVWMAFYGLSDYERGVASYSDEDNLIDIAAYRMDLDLRDLTKTTKLTAKIDLQSRVPGLRAIPFKIGESLSAYQQTRLKKQLRLKAARAEGQPLAFVQEDWESGFTVFLPTALAAGQPLTLEVDLDGDFMKDGDIPECFYPLSNTDWFPRHGELDRATFDITFHHRKRDRIASIGVRVSEQPDPADKEAMVTQYQMTDPVALAVFAVGPFERKTDPLIPLPSGKPIEFNSVPPRVYPVKSDFIVAELGNALSFFSQMFGPYPYATFGAAFHPYGFGQGFPTLLMIPPTDVAAKNTYAFIAHEAAHQWWGNIVSWRSYRDQWLSEGFAEYSGILYTAKRDTAQSAAELIKVRRESLLKPPRTSVGIGKGRLNEIGPLVLGLRLYTSQSTNAYSALIYNKGALVLRMLHFLLSRPDNGDDAAFSAMMTDFVQRYRNRAATTDDFRTVASEHFARSPIAQKYGLTNLDWFFRQWVYQSGLPSYQLEYEFKEHDGGIYLSGTVKQDGVPNDWFMPIPLLLSFDNNQTGRTTVRAEGPSTTFEIKVPVRPKKVELDPASWVLSEKTSTKAR